MGASVAIYRLLQNTAFGPEEIVRMQQAYEKALVLLGLKDRNDPVTEQVAIAVIAAAQSGEKDSALICASALTSLGIMPKG